MGFVGDIVEGIGDVVGTITPFPEDISNIIGGAVLGIPLGGAIGGVIGGTFTSSTLGLGFPALAGASTGMTIGGIAGGMAGMQVSAANRQQNIMKQVEQAQRDRERELREEERRRRAAVRRQTMAEQAMAGIITSNPIGTQSEQRQYQNNIPSLSNTVNMSNT